jgi:transcription initiation factor TFIIIB Brf1 subunit/transcription initiation factor TFIIB
MGDPKCPICQGKCVVKTISEGDARFKEVDVCSACGVVRERRGGRHGRGKGD